MTEYRDTVGPAIEARQKLSIGQKLFPWAGRRPKLASAGNSINAYNCYQLWGGATGNRRQFAQHSHIMWLRALSGHGFEYTRCWPITDRVVANNTQQLQVAWSALVAYTLGDEVTAGGNRYWCAVAESLAQDPTLAVNQVFGTGSAKTAPWVLQPSIATPNSVANWTINSSNGGVEILDCVGNYGAPANTSTNIATRLQSKEFYQRFIDTPDIFYIANFFENTLVTSGLGVSGIIAELDKSITYAKQYWPNCVFIVATPGPSENNNVFVGNVDFQQGIRKYLLDGYSRENVLIENHDSWYRGDPSLGLFDARYGEFYSPDGISANGWAFNGTPASVGNIHPGTLGAIKRAKRFLEQFSWLSGGLSEDSAPGIGQLNSTTWAISDDRAGNGNAFLPVFGFNPALTQIGSPSGVATGNIFITADLPGTNVIATPLQTDSGLQFTVGSSGAVTGTLGSQGVANTLNSNGIELGTRFGSARNINMAGFTGVLFEPYVRVKVTDPKNLGWIAVQMYTATRGALSDGTQREYFLPQGTRQGGGLLGEVGCLEAGDVLTFVGMPFGFGNNADFCALEIRPVLGPAASAGAGPVLELQRLQYVRTTETAWFRSK